MKKTITMALVIAMALSLLTACGGTGENKNSQGAETGSGSVSQSSSQDGKNYETDADKITGDYFTLFFEGNKGDEGHQNSSNEATMASLKRRFNALASSYSISVSEEDKKYITYQVKVSAEHIGIPTLLCLSANDSLRIQSQYKEFATYNDNIKTVDVVEKGGGKYALVCKLSDYAQKQLQTYAEANAGAALYLTCNDTAMSSLTIKAGMSYDTLEFTTLIFSGKDSITAEDKYVPDMLKVVQETAPYAMESDTSKDKRPHSIRVRVIESGGSQNRYETGKYKKLDFPITYWSSTDEMVRGKVQSIYSDGDAFKDFFEFSNLGGSIVIDLPIEPSDHMVNDFMDKLVSIYEACDFDEGAYGKIVFTNSLAAIQNFNINFFKTSDTGKNEQKLLECQATIIGGREGYKEQVMDYIDKSDLFKDRKVMGRR